MENEGNTRKKLRSFLRKVYSCMKQELREGSVVEKYAYGAITTNDGRIEIEMCCNGENHVEVYHNKGEERESPNLCRIIEDNLPDWYTVYDDCIREAREEEEFKEYLRHIY